MLEMGAKQWCECGSFLLSSTSVRSNVVLFADAAGVLQSQLGALLMGFCDLKHAHDCQGPDKPDVAF